MGNRLEEEYFLIRFLYKGQILYFIREKGFNKRFGKSGEGTRFGFGNVDALHIGHDFTIRLEVAFFTGFDDNVFSGEHRDILGKLGMQTGIDGHK